MSTKIWIFDLSLTPLCPLPLIPFLISLLQRCFPFSILMLFPKLTELCKYCLTLHVRSDNALKAIFSYGQCASIQPQTNTSWKIRSLALTDIPRIDLFVLFTPSSDHLPTFRRFVYKYYLDMDLWFFPFIFPGTARCGQRCLVHSIKHSPLLPCSLTCSPSAHSPP